MEGFCFWDNEVFKGRIPLNPVERQNPFWILPEVVFSVEDILPN